MEHFSDAKLEIKEDLRQNSNNDFLKLTLQFWANQDSKI